MNAQLLEFGIKGGLNFANFSGDDINSSNLTSFHIGAVSELKVLQNLSFQAELLYSTQGAEIKDAGNEIKAKLGYLSIPVLAKFYLTTDKLNIHAGPQAGVLLNKSSDFDLNNRNTFDLGIAAGVEYKLIAGLFAQARYVAGITEISKDANIKNNVFQLSVGYMF